MNNKTMDRSTSIKLMGIMTAMLGMSLPETLDIAPAINYEPKGRDLPTRVITSSNQGPRLAGKLRNQICDCGCGLKRKRCPKGGIPKRHVDPEPIPAEQVSKMDELRKQVSQAMAVNDDAEYGMMQEVWGQIRGYSTDTEAIPAEQVPEEKQAELDAAGQVERLQMIDEARDLHTMPED